MHTLTQSVKDGNILSRINKDQLSLTNPRDMLHHGKRAANK